MKEEASQYPGKRNSTKNSKLTKKARFRLECIKRSPIFKEFLNLIRTANQQEISKMGMMDYILMNSKRYGNLISFFCMAVALNIKFDRDDLAWFFLDLPSIEVLTDYTNHKALTQKYVKPLGELKHEMSPYSSHRDLMFGWDPVVEEGNALRIKINLNRKKTDIVDDVRCLLDTLEKYNKYENPDYRFPLDDFEKYFRVYDLRQETAENPKKKSWRQIAREVFPGEREDGAMRKVRHYHDEVERYIREEVWWL